MKTRSYPVCLVLICTVFVAFVFQRAVSLGNAISAAIFPDGTEICAEVASTEEGRRLGLMYRESLGPDEGMLLVFENEGFHSIWMKNCLIPLDIIWLSSDCRIVHIQHSAPPCPANGDCPSFSPMRKSRYVLEVGAGTAAKHALKNGDEIILLGVGEIKR